MLLRFEIYKIFKSRKFLVLLVILVTYILGSIGFQQYQSSVYMKNEALSYMNQAKFSERVAASIKAEIVNLEKQNKSIPNEMQLRLELFNEIARAQGSIGFFMDKNNKEDYSFIVFTQYNLNQRIIEGLEKGLFTQKEINQRGYQKEALNQDLTLANYWINNNKDIELNPYIVTGVSALRTYLSYLNIFVILLFVVFLISDVHVLEVNGGAYKLLMTSPYNRINVYLAKVITMLLLTIIILMGTATLRFGISTLMGGVGDWQFPVASKIGSSTLSLTGFKGEPVVISSLEFLISGFKAMSFSFFPFVVLLSTLSIVVKEVDHALLIICLMVFMTFVLGIFYDNASQFQMWFPPMYLFVTESIKVTKNMNPILGQLNNFIVGVVFFTIGLRQFKYKDFN